MTANPLAHEFAEWAVGLAPEDIPAPVITAARRAILDTIGVSAVGLNHDKVAALKNVTGEPQSSQTIAQVIGMAAHIWDFDDTSYTGIMHGSAVIFPVALALAQEFKSSEEEMISAFIAGSEIAYTLADICGHDHYFKGWWSTVTFGLIGATASACRILGLNTEQSTQAIGLAAAGAGGGKSAFGTDGKAYLVADAASRAIGFARAAQAGLSGPHEGFEDSRGYFALLNSGKAAISEVKKLGIRWRLCEPGLLVKTSPVCSAAHAAIEQMAALLKSANATSNDISAIRAEVPDLVAVSLVYPQPKSPQQAQFSLPYALACAALHGRVTLEDLTPDAIQQPQKTRLMEMTVMSVAADLSTEEMRGKFPESARLTISLSDGRQLSGFCGEAYGMPARPLSEKDLIQKFQYCLQSCGQSFDGFDFEKTNLLTLAAKILLRDFSRHNHSIREKIMQ